MDYANLLKEEYQAAGTEPVYCQLGMGCSLMVPLSYKGNKERFAKDLFKHEQELQKYKDFNRRQSEEKKPLKPQFISCGEVAALAPVELVINNYNDQAIQKRLLKKAIRHYNSTLKKTVRLRKEYPDNKVAARLDRAYVRHMELMHGKYCAAEVAKFIGKSLKFAAKETAQMAGGLTGALPLATYMLLKKHNRIVPSAHTLKLEQKIVPYIRKGLIKAAVLATLAGGVKLANNQVFNQTKVEQAAKQAITDQNPRYKLETDADFEEFYNKCNASAFLATLPTGTLVTKPYCDGNKGGVNSIGAFYYLPKDGKPETSEWIKASEYFKDNPDIEISGQEFYKLMCSFFDTKEGGRLKKNIKKHLMGCELRTCELDAIKSVMLNNEANGIELCKFVKENYQDSIKCAARIMEFTPQRAQFTNGIAKRRVFEAATYLNLNNINGRLPDFMQKKIGKVRSLTAVTQLKPQECKDAFNALQKGDIEPLKKLTDQMCNFCCRGQTVYEITQEHGIENLWNEESRTINMHDAVKGSNAVLYREAQELCSKHKYAEAGEVFQKLVENGACGADLYNDMAENYYHLGKYEKAISCCKLTLETEETGAFAQANHIAGLAYMKSGNISEAMANANLALTREPQNKEYQKTVQQIKAMALYAANGRD